MSEKKISVTKSNDFPKLSIIMPVFNGELYLESSIQSVINQKYPNLEFIIIDGGSKDESLNIINSYRNQIDILISEQDFGLNHAVNKGIFLSTGDFIGWLNADDYYLDNALITIGNYLAKNKNVGLVYGDAAHVDKNGKFICWHGAIPYDKIKLLNERDYIPCQACFFRKSALSHIGLFDTSLKWCGDWDMWKRFAISKKYEIQFLDEKIAAWRIHENTITSGANSSKEMFRRSLENIKSARKYSTRIVSKIEILEIPFLIVGILGLRKILKRIRDKFMTK